MSLVVTTNPVKETLTPSPDGISQAFFTQDNYKNGSVSVWLNGVKLIRDWDDGFEESGGDTITMNEAPLEGDSLQAEYEAL